MNKSSNKHYYDSPQPKDGIGEIKNRLNLLFKEYLRVRKSLGEEKEAYFRETGNPASDQDMPSQKKSEEIAEEARTACRELIRAISMKEAAWQNKDRILSQMEKTVEHYFLTRKLGDLRRVSERSTGSLLLRYVDKDAILSMNGLRRICFPSKSASEYLISQIQAKTSKDTGDALKILRKARDLMGINTLEQLRQDLGGNRFAETFFREIRERFSRDRIVDLISRNPHYENLFRNHWENEQRSARITQGLLDAIPETYPELFPLAREMQRHFILHVGPTNSGKSYEALNALKEADTGVYLAPLRLLAYEKYEELNEAGVLCSLKTGEEEIQVPGAAIRSSTIEVLDFTRSYEVAVIDEAQMVQDAQRGSAWTMALLGIQAETIHVCLAPEGQKVLEEIIRSCEDTYEIVRHERLVPLLTREYSKPVFPKRAQEGDAFIVFSRRDVHAAASELRENGHKCSVIYGNLPYDVRRGEVKRYINKETDVVVATDAIGMGLNLPIKRIIFLTLTKFDGEKDRLLFPSEIKQIAGRAGRFGIFDEGIVTSDDDFALMEAGVHERPVFIKKARIGFPYSLIGIEGLVSELMEKWGQIKPKPGFEMTDMTREIDLARLLEKETEDKDLVYKFVMFPFDEKNETLKTVWHELFRAEKNEDSDYMKWLPAEPSRKAENLRELEEDFKVCDILYHYADTFTDRSHIQEILQRKSSISAAIMRILSREKLESRTCKYCGKPLPFHYPYGICRECFRSKNRDSTYRRRRRR